MNVRRMLLAAAAAAATGMAQATPVPLANAGFEAGWTGASTSAGDCCVWFVYEPSGPGLAWDFGFKTGVAWYFNRPPTLAPYEGERFAFLQTATDALSQVFTLATEADLTVSFASALRPGYRAGQTVQVEVDGTPWLHVNATDGWTYVSGPVGRLAAGAHTLTFRGISGFDRFGDTTAFIDAVSLDARAVDVPEPATLGLALAALAALPAGGCRRQRAACRPSR